VANKAALRETAHAPPEARSLNEEIAQVFRPHLHGFAPRRVPSQLPKVLNRGEHLRPIELPEIRRDEAQNTVLEPSVSYSPCVNECDNQAMSRSALRSSSSSLLSVRRSLCVVHREHECFALLPRVCQSLPRIF
jgi:hypothetical protein